MRLKSLRLKKIVFPLLLVGLGVFILVAHRSLSERGALRWYDRTLIFLTSPLTQGVLAARREILGIFERYFFLAGVEKENEAFRQKIADYQTRDVLLRSVEQENQRLLQLMELRKQFPGEWRAARVVAYPPLSPHRLLTINKGSADGMALRNPVISSEGLVGQIARVAGHSSQVLLITDPTSAVDGRVEATGVRGLIVGKSISLKMDRELYLSAFEYLSRSTEIEDGAPVVSSGLDGIFPEGILIGHVRGHKKRKQDVFQQAEITPAADFNKLQEVLVLVAPP